MSIVNVHTSQSDQSEALSTLPASETGVNVNTDQSKLQNVEPAIPRPDEGAAKSVAPTRRTIMNMMMSTAALTATATPASTDQFVPKGDQLYLVHPDTKLLELGRLAAPLYREYDIALAIFQPLWEEHSRRVEEWAEQNPSRRPGEGYEAYRRLYDEVGLTALSDQHPDRTSDKIDPIVRSIIEMPATTIDGLAVIARAAKFGANHIWNESDDDADWDHLVLRKLVDAVIKAASGEG